MKNKLLFVLLISIVLQGIYIKTQAQKTNQDSIYVTDNFDGIISEVCIHDVLNYTSEIKEAYKIRDYYISVQDITQMLVDSLIGKRVIVSGKLLIYKGDVRYERSGNKGQLVNKIIEPDILFIKEPAFSIINDSNEPIIKD